MLIVIYSGTSGSIIILLMSSVTFCFSLLL